MGLQSFQQLDLLFGQAVGRFVSAGDIVQVCIQAVTLI
jgi:hypothetical protein